MKSIEIGSVAEDALSVRTSIRTAIDKIQISSITIRRITVLLILSLALVMRVVAINSLGFNSDEAVYVGQAAALAEDPDLSKIFPIFRAHPLLYQFILAVFFQFGVSDLLARIVSSLIGVLTVYVVFLMGEQLYGPLVGLLSALFIAIMPYHVIVSRQILLDGPFTFFATLTLYLLVRFMVSRNPIWLYAAGACMGLTILAKETGIIFFGSIFTFFSFTPRFRIRIKDLLFSLAYMLLAIAPYPITSLFARGASERTQQYLIWQFFRPPNHEWNFYLENVPAVIGIALVLVAVIGLVISIRSWGWREMLLLAWILVPLIFFQLWPTKGFQYLLPLAPPLAVLGARAVSSLLSYNNPVSQFRKKLLTGGGVILMVIISLSLATSSWQRVFPSLTMEFLAGSGGVPGGRESGLWIRDNVPEGATIMTIGPSMANILMFYGHRQALGLSVSPNPLNRNPSYRPIRNPDYKIRTGEIQYIAWDSFSAGRSSFFSEKLLSYVQKYNGRVVFTKTIKTQAVQEDEIYQTLIVIYEVHP